jgi:hypothetical protein
METIKVRVENGKIVGPAPRGMPEGTELELRIADPGDELTEDELAALNKALEAGWRSVEAGRFRPAGEVMTDLRNRR